MFEIQTHPKRQAFEYTSAVIGSVVACAVLLAGLVVVEQAVLA